MDTEKVKRTQLILKVTFGIVPIVAGLDKFTNLLADWTAYLPQFLVAMLPVSPEVFLYAVGIIEIVAGIIVLTKTEIGAYIVSAWLALIALTLILAGHYDIAVRDAVMAVSAFSLAQLTRALEK